MTLDITKEVFKEEKLYCIDVEQKAEFRTF
jgi:hypothetical protein